MQRFPDRSCSGTTHAAWLGPQSALTPHPINIMTKWSVSSLNNAAVPKRNDLNCILHYAPSWSSLFWLLLVSAAASRAPSAGCSSGRRRSSWRTRPAAAAGTRRPAVVQQVIYGAAHCLFLRRNHADSFTRRFNSTTNQSKQLLVGLLSR